MSSTQQTTSPTIVEPIVAKRARKPNRSQEEIDEEKAAIAERKAARVTAKADKEAEKAEKRTRKPNRSQAEIDEEKAAIAERKAARVVAKAVKEEKKAAARTRKPNRSQVEIDEEKAAIAERKAARVAAKAAKEEEKATKSTRKPNRPKTEVDAENAAKAERKAEREQKREKKRAQKPKMVDAEGNEIKKNQTAYFLFQDSKRTEVKALLAEEGDGKVNIGDIAKKIGTMWKDMYDEDKEQFHNQATEDKVRYESEVADNPENITIMLKYTTALMVSKETKAASKKAAKKAAKEAEKAAKSGIDAQEPDVDFGSSDEKESPVVVKTQSLDKLGLDEATVPDDLTVKVEEHLVDLGLLQNAETDNLQNRLEKAVEEKAVTEVAIAELQQQEFSAVNTGEPSAGEHLLAVFTPNVTPEKTMVLKKKHKPRRSKEVIEAEKVVKAERKAIRESKKTKLVIAE